MIARLAELGVSPSKVTDLYTEYYPCDGSVNYLGRIIPQFYNENFSLTYSFPWSSDAQVQDAA